MQRVVALLDYGATTIIISPCLLKTIELPHGTAFTSTHGVNLLVKISATESRKPCLKVQYFEQLKPVDKSEVFVIPMMAYDLVLGLQWFKARNPEIDWTKRRLMQSSS